MAMKSGPLSRRRSVALNYGTLRDPFPLRVIAGRRRSLLKPPISTPPGYSVSEMDPVILCAFRQVLSTCGLFQALSGHVLRARRSPMLIRHRVARQATG